MSEGWLTSREQTVLDLASRPWQDDWRRYPAISMDLERRYRGRATGSVHPAPLASFAVMKAGAW